MAATDGPTPKRIEARRTMAETAIKGALMNGKQVDDVDCLKKFLQEYAQELDLPKEWFDIIPEKALFNLFIKLVTPLVQSSTNNHRPPSPPESYAGGIVSPQSEAAPGPVGVPDTDESSGKPTYKEDEQRRLVRFHNPSSGSWVLAYAKRCEQAESFISKAILEEKKLLAHVQNDTTVLLSWDAYGELELPKAITTRFKVVSDDDIENDIAIGTAYDKRNEVEVEVPVNDLKNKLHLGEHNGSEGDLDERAAKFAAVFWREMNGKRLREEDHPAIFGSKRSRKDSFG